MRRLLPLLFVLASCAEPLGGPPVPTMQSSAISTVTTAQAAPAQENCREFQAPITIGGQQQQAYGRACQQPDGTWQIMPPAGQSAAAPGQTAVPPTIIYPGYPPYPYYDPWWGPPWWGPPWWGPPFGVGVGLGFVFGGHHRFHHHHHH